MSRWIGGWGVVVGDLFVYGDHDVTGDLDVGGDADVVGDLIVGGELQGARLMLTGGLLAAITADAPLDGTGAVPFATNRGYVMPRAGSVVGVSVNFTVTAETTPGNATLQAMIENTAIFSCGDIAISGLGIYEGYAVQARGVDTFAAGDIVRLKFDFTGFVGTIDKILGLLEVQFDT